MAADENTLRVPKVRACHHRVSDASDLKVVQSPQGRFDEIGELTFMVGLAGDIDQRGSQIDRVGQEIEGGHAATVAA